MTLHIRSFYAAGIADRDGDVLEQAHAVDALDNDLDLEEGVGAVIPAPVPYTHLCGSQGTRGYPGDRTREGAGGDSGTPCLLYTSGVLEHDGESRRVDLNGIELDGVLRIGVHVADIGVVHTHNGCEVEMCIRDRCRRPRGNRSAGRTRWCRSPWRAGSRGCP